MLNIPQLTVSVSIYNKSVYSAVAEMSESFIVPAVRKAIAKNGGDDPSHTTVCFDSS
jgi:hypothetical protein